MRSVDTPIHHATRVGVEGRDVVRLYQRCLLDGSQSSRFPVASCAHRDAADAMPTVNVTMRQARKPDRVFSKPLSLGIPKIREAYRIFNESSLLFPLEFGTAAALVRLSVVTQNEKLCYKHSIRFLQFSNSIERFIF